MVDEGHHSNKVSMMLRRMLYSCSFNWQAGVGNFIPLPTKKHIKNSAKFMNGNVAEATVQVSYGGIAIILDVKSLHLHLQLQPTHFEI